MVTIARVNAAKTYGRTRRAASGRRWQRRPGRARRARAPYGRIFLPRATQHVRRAPSARDWAGGAAMVAAAGTWCVLVLLAAG
jgi:hypothetical protein